MLKNPALKGESPSWDWKVGGKAPPSAEDWPEGTASCGLKALPLRRRPGVGWSISSAGGGQTRRRDWSVGQRSSGHGSRNRYCRL